MDDETSDNQVNTLNSSSEGAQITGDVTAGGADFIRRDMSHTPPQSAKRRKRKTVRHTSKANDKTVGDVVGGDKVGGDKITVHEIRMANSL